MLRMNRSVSTLIFAAFAAGPAAAASAQQPGETPAAVEAAREIVGRLNLESYKATVKGLTQFGDRREGTDRNRAAIDWIEARLKSYGCPTERLRYMHPPPRPATATTAGRANTPPQGATTAARGGSAAAGGGAPAGGRGAAPADGRGAAPAAGRGAAPAGPAAGGGRGAIPTSAGGGRPRGIRTRTSVNTDPNAQPDEKLRALNSQPSAPGPREEVYCTKVGTTRPGEMYIVGAHMDGHGWGEAANDNGSGTALVMELARVLSSPDVQTERSIRFVLWNNEETGLNGSRAYVEQRRALQGREDPPGSGRYPEPKWLGMIQHDMMMFDHGMPRADGTISPTQRPEADVNIEFQTTAKLAAEAQALAWVWHRANERYATDYPASVGNHMTNTDSTSFMDDVPSISVRENERGTQIGSGWDPHWHQPTDVFATFSDDDFRLGLNAAQTSLGAVIELTGAGVRR
jgi:hypothetical protein